MRPWSCLMSIFLHLHSWLGMPYIHGMWGSLEKSDQENEGSQPKPGLHNQHLVFIQCLPSKDFFNFLSFLFFFSCFDDVWSLCSFEGCWRPLGGRPANTSVFFAPRVMVGSSFQTCMIPLLQAHPPCFIQMDHLLAIPFFRLCPWEKVAPLQAVTALSLP